MDQILDRLVGSSYFCFLDRYLGYNQIVIHPNDQEKTMFTYPFGTDVGYFRNDDKYGDDEVMMER